MNLPTRFTRALLAAAFGVVLALALARPASAGDCRIVEREECPETGTCFIRFDVVCDADAA